MCGQSNRVDRFVQGLGYEYMRHTRKLVDWNYRKVCRSKVTVECGMQIKNNPLQVQLIIIKNIF